jgi:hypothetical protein
MEEPRSLLADFVRTWDRNFRRADHLATSRDVIPLLAELNSLIRRARVGRARQARPTMTPHRRGSA